MEETRLQKNEESQQGKSYTGVWMGVGIFLVIYFCFPMLLIYPLYTIFRHRQPPPAVKIGVGIFFYPVEKLEQTVPAYRGLLQAEADLMGMD